MAVKALYRGYFPTRMKTYVERTQAFSERQAWLIFVRRIAHKSQAPINLVMDWFSNPENYKIEIEVKFEEVDT